MSVEDKKENSSGAILHTVVKSYRANRRQGTHATKTRSLVSGGGKKPFKQKGTGGARQGSSRSPLREGGGVAHGPQPRLYKQKCNKKLKKVALSLSMENKKEYIVVAKPVELKTFSTKKALSYLVSSGVDVSKSVLVVLEKQNDIQYRSMRNLPRVSIKLASDINAEDVLRSKSILATKEALAVVNSRIS
jgi:large subunit ribosomal protein L4